MLLWTKDDNNNNNNNNNDNNNNYEFLWSFLLMYREKNPDVVILCMRNSLLFKLILSGKSVKYLNALMSPVRDKNSEIAGC